ncbi:5-methyltetrahydropteroyltriglutamate--homocysteine methyltransferase [Salix suchowensis]|nr:5-methyltetrahydropteroyltriglutamate--homocysteine methyltransferase [Salix suchowensis]
MASHIVGYPRMGPKRELKFALESFWDGKSSAGDLQKVAADLRESIWKQMADTGIKYIPSNTFSCYDQVLDTTAMLGAVPPRYGWNGGEIGSDVYFSMARGNASVPAMEMTKWFDTNYHFIVPELGPDVKFSYASHKAVTEYKEAKALGVDTVPVLVGPVSYLLLSKPAKGVEESFSLLSFLGKILPIYKEVITELKEAGASWIQFDEPTLVMDLESHKLHAFTEAYSALESTLSGLNVLIKTYFADIPAEQYKTLTSLKGVTAFGFDLVRGTKTLDLIKGDFPEGKYLFAGVVDGRNIWANDLAASLSTLETLEGIVGKGKLVVSTSCSLLHTAVDLVNETKLDKEIKSWLAFAAQKVVEVNALAKALAGQKDEEIFSANAAAQASRKSSPRVTNEAVQKAAAALKGSDHRPMKGMLTGPVTILNWSFVRNDQPRFETCYQIALAIKDEVEDLEKNGITVIQIDEAALREGLPLSKSEQAFYLDWAVHSFRITNCGVLDTTQIHTHMCYSNFNDIIHSIIDMDADVITIENSRSNEKLLSVIPIQRLIPAQMKEKRDKGLCFKCDHKWGPGQRCGGPKLFGIEETKGDRDPIDNTEDYLRYLPKEVKEEIGISPPAIKRSPSPKTMRIKIMVNSHEYIALIDTGSNHNFLQPWVAREVGLKIIKDDPIEVRIADGSIMCSEGSCPEFKFVIQGCQFATQAYILQLDGFDVILGIQWLMGLGQIKNWTSRH